MIVLKTCWKTAIWKIVKEARRGEGFYVGEVGGGWIEVVEDRVCLFLFMVCLTTLSVAQFIQRQLIGQ
jgi:hypothetical protein